MSDTKATRKRGGQGSGCKARASRALGPAQNAKQQRSKKTTERTLLQEMIGQLEGDKGALASIMAKLLEAGKDGDKDALAFIGKYFMGNGKVSLDDLTNPPLIKKSR
jgi:hypothetical protein